MILDRDGTLIAERHYLSDPEDVELLPNAAAGLRLFEEMGWGRVLVTNQSGVGRKYFDGKCVEAVHGRMRALLAEDGASLDGIYVCPHAPEDNCACRKPKPALVLQAAAEWDFDVRESVVIGDKACDIDLGRALGATTILVRTGYGAEQLTSGEARPDFVIGDLTEAADLVEKMKNGKPEKGPELWHGSDDWLRGHLAESIATKRRLLDENAAILKAAAVITGSLAANGKLLLCGNGGSAADCQHIAAELVNALTQDFRRPGLPAIALTTDSSILTANANDSGYAGVFERQVQALGRPGDVLVGISTSGNSENVIRALRYAREHGMHTIALTGASGGRMADCAGVVIRVPSQNVQHVQESHITIGHIICALVERSLFPGA